MHCVILDEYIFLIGFICFLFFFSIEIYLILFDNILYRCVPERHKTLATGFLWTILRLFGKKLIHLLFLEM